MPGSPPIKIAEPRTKPPPVTRSSSDKDELKRGGVSTMPDSFSSANARPFFAERDVGALAIPVPMTSSTIEFHSLQASHLPDHLLETAPQFWQTNWERALAILSFRHPRACPEDLDARNKSEH